jgi:SprT protein
VPQPELRPAPGLEAALAAALEGFLGSVQQALAAQGAPPLPTPALRFFTHRLDAGRALAPSAPGAPGVLELNLVYLERESWESSRATIGHELAHLVVFHLHPRRRIPPHGALWQRIMRDWLGLPPERTHHFSSEGLSVRRQRRWPYRCGCQDHALSTVRHRRAERGAAYRCRHCGETLHFTGES